MNLGFIGTGKIASSVITGISNSKISYKKIIISPRNIKIAKNLRKKSIITREVPKRKTSSQSPGCDRRSKSVVLIVGCGCMREIWRREKRCQFSTRIWRPIQCPKWRRLAFSWTVWRFPQTTKMRLTVCLAIVRRNLNAIQRVTLNLGHWLVMKRLNAWTPK